MQGLADPENLKSKDGSSLDLEDGKIKVQEKTIQDLLIELIQEVKELKEIIMEVA